jgi:phenol 2-monooxygenase
MPLEMHVDHSKTSDASAYPITLTLKHLTDDELPKSQTAALLGPVTADSYNLTKGDEKELKKPTSGKEGTTEIVHAKYVIGCDGASSWTRRYIDIPFEGDSKDSVWGVVDMLCDTDFRKPIVLSSRKFHMSTDIYE